MASSSQLFDDLLDELRKNMSWSHNRYPSEPEYAYPASQDFTFLVDSESNPARYDENNYDAAQILLDLGRTTPSFLPQMEQLGTFHKFLKLPPELRRIIWRFAQIASARVIEVQIDKTRSIYYTRTKMPQVLYACKESEEVVRKAYKTLRLDNKTALEDFWWVDSELFNSGIHTDDNEPAFEALIDFEIDILYLRTYDCRTVFGTRPFFEKMSDNILCRERLQSLAINPRGYIFLDEIEDLWPAPHAALLVFLHHMKLKNLYLVLGDGRDGTCQGEGSTNSRYVPGCFRSEDAQIRDKFEAAIAEYKDYMDLPNSPHWVDGWGVDKMVWPDYKLMWMHRGCYSGELDHEYCLIPEPQLQSPESSSSELNSSEPNSSEPNSSEPNFSESENDQQSE
ncbi:hypothetical protein BP6252_06906 [Coleophoma cylindrospora]|uniref:2EXR domain-containing protein n=1 Tax=Coleophoma cylindrospora TaxID=1849047 RepID=A0A3D8RG21_9HELO|nr:hypothetical protein BP6252_06906 [Coleophoma cylindrospora]